MKNTLNNDYYDYLTNFEIIAGPPYRQIHGFEVDYSYYKEEHLIIENEYFIFPVFL